MGLTSLQVCMDSSDWLQGTIHEETTGMDSSSSPSPGDILTCSSRPLMERRLRPPHDHPLKCPRCDSTHTKFCYYNNYSLSQPRYFCKTCRRYWTKGGTLRNIPVGGGCRKNKKVSSSSSKKSNDLITPQNPSSLSSPSISLSSSFHNPTDLQLSYPEMQLSHLHNLLGNHYHGGLELDHLEAAAGNTSFMDTKYNNNVMLENNPPFDFSTHSYKYEALVGTSTTGLGGDHHDFQYGVCSPFGVPLEHQGNSTGNMLQLPYHHEDHQDQNENGLDIKPNTKVLSLEWQGCSDSNKDSAFGYYNGLASWTGLMNSGYGSSATNPLV